MTDGELVAALEEQLDELAGLLVDGVDWSAPTRCDGWDVADVVLHLAQTNEMAIGSLTGTYAEVLDGLGRDLSPATDVDHGAALMVERDRVAGPAAIHERWAGSAEAMRRAFAVADADDKVVWVAGQLRVRTLATTRLAETWIHTGDVAGALGVTLEPAPRLRHIARLAWRTVPYAFQKAGRPPPEPTAFRLVGPDGEPWAFEPDAPAVNVITGPGADLCNVAARRVPATVTALKGDGPDAIAILDLVRTYA